MKRSKVQTRRGFLRSRFLRDVLSILVLLGALLVSFVFMYAFLVCFDFLVKLLS